MLRTLDHVTLRSVNLAEAVTFYEQVLGLQRGPRPPFGIRGHWLYAGTVPLVHLLEAGAPMLEQPIDHVAFEAVGRSQITDRLCKAGVPFELRALPDGSALQMFVTGPDRARLELVFRCGEDR